MFYNYLSISNIVTEFFVMVTPIVVLWKIHVTRTRKSAVLSCFGARVV
jgi:hypothetical protein